MDRDAGKDAIFGNLNRLTRILNQLDERGLVLALAAFAEEALGDLIEAFLIPGDPAKQLLKGFNVTCSPNFLPLVSWVHPLEMDHAAKPFH